MTGGQGKCGWILGLSAEAASVASIGVVETMRNGAYGRLAAVSGAGWSDADADEVGVDFTGGGAVEDARFTPSDVLYLEAFGDHGLVVADLVEALRNQITSDDGLSLVATNERRNVVGHVMFTRSLLDAPRRLVDVQVLSPVAVLPAWQGRGVGASLVTAGLQVMAERSVPVVFLEGDPGYYSRVGFAAGASQGSRGPSLRIPDLAFQALRLPAHEPWMTGTLVYSETFWRLDAVGLRDGRA